MDMEKVINELVEHIESALSVDSDYVDCVRTDLWQYTVAMLKEQEAVKPIRKKLKFSETWECGNCHEELFEGDVIHDNYCWNCGRKVNWG